MWNTLDIIEMDIRPGVSSIGYETYLKFIVKDQIFQRVFLQIDLVQLINRKLFRSNELT